MARGQPVNRLSLRTLSVSVIPASSEHPGSGDRREGCEHGCAAYVSIYSPLEIYMLLQHRKRD